MIPISTYAKLHRETALLVLFCGRDTVSHLAPSVVRVHMPPHGPVKIKENVRRLARLHLILLFSKKYLKIWTCATTVPP